MDTGTQRENWIHLTDCHWITFRGKAIRLIVALLLVPFAMMTMISPAYATATYYLPGSPTWTGATPAEVCVSHPNFCGGAPGMLISSMTCGIVPGSAVLNPSFCNSYTEPIALNNCPIPGLTPLTDPVAIDFENGARWRPDRLTADYQTKLACVQNGIVARGGTSVGTSAYRPTQYQQHLYEIIKKDVKLDTDYMSAHPECQALRDEITRAMGPPPGHNLQYDQPVARPGRSRHESGMAFDVTPSRLTDAQLAPVYSGCGVTHTAVRGEPWHVQ